MVEREQKVILEFTPELAVRVLRGAINDFLGYDARTEEFELAHEWLFDDELNEVQDIDFISLKETCEMLEIDVEKVRLCVNLVLDKGKSRLIPTEMEAFLKCCQ